LEFILLERYFKRSLLSTEKDGMMRTEDSGRRAEDRREKLSVRKN